VVCPVDRQCCEAGVGREPPRPLDDTAVSHAAFNPLRHLVRSPVIGRSGCFDKPVMLRSEGIGEQCGDHQGRLNGGRPVTDLSIAEFDNAPYAVVV
jgi:hypothetical protein